MAKINGIKDNETPVIDSLSHKFSNTRVGNSQSECRNYNLGSGVFHDQKSQEDDYHRQYQEDGDMIATNN